MRTTEGQHRFKLSNNSLDFNLIAVKMSSMGAACGNHQHRDEICSKVTCDVTCMGVGVTPEGDCCERCGALVTMETNDVFDFKHCESTLRLLLQENVSFVFKNALSFDDVPLIYLFMT